jgi:uncharacterized protein
LRPAEYLHVARKTHSTIIAGEPPFDVLRRLPCRASAAKRRHEDRMPYVAALSVFPVKSMRGQAVPAAVVEPWGLAGDRRLLVVDEAGRFLTQREVPRMATITAQMDPGVVVLSQEGRAPIRLALPDPEGEPLAVTVWRDRVPAMPVGDTADAWLADALGRACRLVFMDRPDSARPVDPAYGAAEDHVSFADGFPLLLTTTASLADLNGRLAEPIPMDRFRPNLVVAGSAAWAEDHWTLVLIGAVAFDVAKPCARCIVTTTDQNSGDRNADLEPIRTLQRFRRDAQGQVVFGQNLIPRSTGRIAAGDPVAVLP